MELYGGFVGGEFEVGWLVGRIGGEKNVSFPHIFAMEGKAAVMKIVEDTLN